MGNDYKALTRYGHLAVRMNHCIIVFGGMGMSKRTYSIHTLWMYNMYTEAWEEHSVPLGDLTEHWEKKFLPEVKGVSPAIQFACAVAIGADIFVFGGMCVVGHTELSTYVSNGLFKLGRKHRGEFSWSCIKYRSKVHSPSPRFYHTGWEYAEKLWIFGGKGPTNDGYLNDNGDFMGPYNNQFLCFDPLCEKWTNPPCSGNIPEPRCDHFTAILRDTVWLTGGINDTKLFDDRCFDDIYQLDMHSLVWTKMQASVQKPSLKTFISSFTAISNRQLLLQVNFVGAYGMIASEGWVLDTLSASWRKHATALKDKHPRMCNTATPGINNTIIIIGGHDPNDHSDSGSRYHRDTLHVMLEPKSLQQLAVKTIYKLKAELPCEALPKSLQNLLGFL